MNERKPSFKVARLPDFWRLLPRRMPENHKLVLYLDVATSLLR